MVELLGPDFNSVATVDELQYQRVGVQQFALPRRMRLGDVSVMATAEFPVGQALNGIADHGTPDFGHHRGRLSSPGAHACQRGSQAGTLRRYASYSLP